jgi:glycerophosphoryl diester phosphodiesterase
MPLLVIAHRGESADRPENTLAAFERALEVGLDIIELDVQLSADGHAVVIHDPTVDRTTNGSGRVGEMDLASIRSLSAGYPAHFGLEYASERVLTLREALECLKGRARVMIEIKPDSVRDGGEDGIEAVTVSEVRRLKMEDEVAIISFDRRALARCRALAPAIRRGQLFIKGTPAEVVESALQLGVEFVLPQKAMLSDELCRLAEAAGIKVGTWVVDDANELPALSRFGLFGVASNRPTSLQEAVRRLASCPPRPATPAGDG